jgi:triacylglycerol lipase
MSNIGHFSIVFDLDWEMRGARGIEFGVDLPAFPVIGLGSVLPTSVTRTLNNTPTPPTDQGDGWGFGVWTRFVVAWMKNKSEAASRDRDMNKRRSQGHQEDSLSSSLSQPQPQKHETPSVERSRERLAGDDTVRSRTDALSAVFDWLIERVPAPKRILGVRSTGGEGGAKARNYHSEGKAAKEPEEAVKSSETLEKQVTNPGWDDAVTYTVSHGVGSSASSSSSTSTGTSEIKRRMNSEKANLKKPNELGSKDDLERFYVALTRKMYDEGL